MVIPPSSPTLSRLALLALVLLTCPILAVPALAQVSPPAANPVPASADPVQFYVFSFTDTPVAEAAQDVVGGALAFDLTVDPAVEGVVSFRADGWYGSEALLRDFGAALLDQDIALMRTAPGAYALIPRANMPIVMARGGVPMTLAEPTTARPPTPEPAATRPVTYRRTRWWDSAFAALLIFFGGALAGGAAVLGGQAVYRRAETQTGLGPSPLRLTDQRLRFERPVEVDVDPDLVIPRFDEIHRL